MKSLLVFLLGMVVGAFAYNLYQQRDTPHRAAGSPSSPSVSGSDSRFNRDDIKRELEQTGQVVRAKTQKAGEKIADARITAMVKAKYVLDRELSAWDISVDTQDGTVTLMGTVSSADLVAKATAIALDTDGVHNVTAKLVVK